MTTARRERAFLRPHMTATPTLYTAPATEPLTLAEARMHLRIDSGITSEDDLITAFIVNAREQAEHEIGRRLITQTWEWQLDAFPASGESIRLHGNLVPVASVAQITYMDADGDQQTLSADAYVLDNKVLPGYIFEADGYSWPETADSANAVTIRVVCGYGDADDVPAGIKTWMRLQIGALYENRSAIASGRWIAPLPGGFTDRLLDAYRVWQL